MGLLHSIQLQNFHTHHLLLHCLNVTNIKRFVSGPTVLGLFFSVLGFLGPLSLSLSGARGRWDGRCNVLQLYNNDKARLCSVELRSWKI